MSDKKNIVLITGATKGIGLGLTHHFATNGYQVIGCSRSQPSDSYFKNESQMRFTPKFVAADLTKQQDVKKITDYMSSEFQKIDVLVNNVGGTDHFGHFSEISEEDWINTYNLNVVAPVRLIKNILPLLEKSSHPRIINISSTTAVMPGFYNPHYSAAKAALLNLNKHLSNVYAEKGILVNAINVGPIKTESWNENVKNLAQLDGVSVEAADDRLTSEEQAKIPLHKLGEPKDVAQLALFLASENTKWLTGACINLDGGKFRGVH